MIGVETALRQTLDQFVDTLQGLPDARVELEAPHFTAGDGGYDAQVTLWLAGKAITLLVDMKKTLYPRDAQQILWRLKELGRNWSKGSKGHEAVPVLIAELISPGAKDLLKSERVGYL